MKKIFNNKQWNIHWHCRIEFCHFRYRIGSANFIYKTPEEALNLDSFEPHIRPHLKDIFLNKYPNTVALHSLDAGNVSKTLEHTSLRLVPGEILPRHRKVYHLSPQDSAYLEELLEHFIKYLLYQKSKFGLK